MNNKFITNIKNFFFIGAIGFVITTYFMGLSYLDMNLSMIYNNSINGSFFIISFFLIINCLYQSLRNIIYLILGICFIIVIHGCCIIIDSYTHKFYLPYFTYLWSLITGIIFIIYLFISDDYKKYIGKFLQSLLYMGGIIMVFFIPKILIF